MKKFFLIGSVFFITFFNYLFSNIEYRLAVKDDLDDIFSLYMDFNEDDKSKLLIFPDSMQKQIILNNIKKRRFFIAIDLECNKIVSFLKLHIALEDELQDILFNELCLGENRNLITNFSYIFTDNMISNFGRPLETTSELLLLNDELNYICENKINSCLYIYHGAAYTLNAYRRRGISTNLLKYAFNFIKKDFKNKEYLALLYGQVNSNTKNVAMVRVFAKCIAGLYRVPFKLQHIRCVAYKPEVSEDGKVQIFHDDDHCGLGSIVIYKLMQD